MCVLVCALYLRPPNPGWGLWCVGWVWSASFRVPLFNASCARFRGLRKRVAIVASHLSVCLECGRLRASWPCMVRCAVSGQVALGAPGGLPVAVVPSPTGGLGPQFYWAAVRGTWRAAKNRAHAPYRWRLPRHGRLAPSA